MAEDTGNVNFSGNQKSNNIQSGIFSKFQYNQAQQNLNQDAFRDNGYIQQMQKSLKDVLDLMQKTKQYEKELGASQKNRLTNLSLLADKINSKLEKVGKTQEVSYDSILDLVKDIGKLQSDSSELELTRLKRQIDALELKKKKTNDERLLLQKTRQDYEAITDSLILAKDLSEDMLNTIEKQGDILKNNTSSWVKATSETLDNVGSVLSSLANMFNIEKIANSGVNQWVNKKLDLQNQMMKDFGMASQNQYLNFKNNLDVTLSSMGSIYNSTDLRTYMQNAQKNGLTNTKTIEVLAKSSIQATKYLGTSDETQQMMFKYMKNTNSYDMLDEHNKTIVGLLTSQLGVSRDQLDELTQMALNDLDALDAININSDVLDKYREGYTVTGAALRSNLGKDTADKIMGVITELANSDYTNGAALTKKYGPNAIGMMHYLQNTGDVSSIVSSLLSSGNYGIISGDASVNATYQASLGQDRNINAALQAGNANYGDIMTDIRDGMDAIANNTKTIDDFIEDTTELTPIDKLANTVDQFMNNIDWPGFVHLSTAAAAAIIASNVLSTVNTIGTAFKGTGWLTKFFGNGGVGAKAASATTKLAGSGAGGILAAGGGILLGIGAANIISAAINSAYQKREKAEMANASYNLAGTSLENNSAAAAAMGLGSTYSDENNNVIKGIGSGFSNTTRWIGIGTLGYLRSLNTINKDDWNLFKNNLNMRKMSQEDIEAYATVWGLLLMSAGRVGDVDDPTLKSLISNKSDLAKYMQERGWGKTYLNNIAKDIKPKPNRSEKEDQTYIDWDRLALDGYHLNGKNYIPKDNYRALLHKGEMVLSAEEAKRYRGIGGAESVGPHATGSYGMNHKGIDVYFGQIGTPVGSAVPGTVVDSSDIPYNPNDGKKYHGADTNGTKYSSYGRVVKIKGDNDNLTYIYGHLNQRMVGNGQHVNAGDLIGYSGTTGNSSGPHLHFEIAGHGAGFNNHAPWFTSSVRNIGDTSGAVEQPGTQSGLAANSNGQPALDGDFAGSIASASVSSRPVQTKRVLPSSAIHNTGGIGGAELVSNSVNNGINKIINYLDSIKNEQNIQREMLNAFSKANSSSVISS